MLDDWLTLTLAATDAADTRPLEGKLAGGRYRMRGHGVLELTPRAPRPGVRPLVVSAGIHGNETAPIELVGELLAALEAGRLTLGAPLLVILGNVPAIRAGTRFIDTNLNRLFRRDLDATGDEADRARELMQAVDSFLTAHPERALHLDLHTAIRDSRYPRFAVVPHTDTATPSSWPLLAEADMQAVLLQHQHSWTFSHYSRHYHGVEAYTLELGQVRPFGDNDLEALAGMRGLLARVTEGLDGPQTDYQALPFYRVAFELTRDVESFRFTFADDVANFTPFAAGERLTEAPGSEDFVVPDEPLAVVFPNARVELGARAALLVRRCEPPAAAAG
ncbi:succinylglutamate desuccinylase [Salinicola aestuarinus]|uniref:succinylglutamate desuccinylase n=1 Tax=Salinicola aestuarinus TaxID=1949082 RepID=UPI000DA1B115|nr:succinylglutamate desuccinylase [Salinicola aestuarinus]